MKRASSIEALLRKTRSTLTELKREYSDSLASKTIRDDLKVDIKNVFENLRSCLDYLAHEMHDNVCASTRRPRKLYFPITHGANNFKKMMSESYPTLHENNASLYAYLESLQPYNDVWLGHFNDLNNENKHQDLAEQTRTESRTVAVSSPTGQVSWGPGVKFGSGVSVMGVPINPSTQLPVQNALVTTHITVWVDFKFQKNNLSVLTFIEESIARVETIFHEIQRYLQ